MASFLLLSVCNVDIRDFCWSFVIGDDEEEVVPARGLDIFSDDDFRASVLALDRAFVLQIGFEIRRSLDFFTGLELSTMQSSFDISGAG